MLAKRKLLEAAIIIGMEKVAAPPMSQFELGNAAAYGLKPQMPSVKPPAAAPQPRPVAQPQPVRAPQQASQPVKPVKPVTPAPTTGRQVAPVHVPQPSATQQASWPAHVQQDYARAAQTHAQNMANPKLPGNLPQSEDMQYWRTLQAAGNPNLRRYGETVHDAQVRASRSYVDSHDYWNNRPGLMQHSANILTGQAPTRNEMANARRGYIPHPGVAGKRQAGNVAATRAAALGPGGFGAAGANARNAYGASTALPAGANLRNAYGMLPYASRVVREAPGKLWRGTTSMGKNVAATGGTLLGINYMLGSEAAAPGDGSAGPQAPTYDVPDNFAETSSIVDAVLAGDVELDTLTPEQRDAGASLLRTRAEQLHHAGDSTAEEYTGLARRFAPLSEYGQGLQRSDEQLQYNLAQLQEFEATGQLQPGTPEWEQAKPIVADTVGHYVKDYVDRTGLNEEQKQAKVQQLTDTFMGSGEMDLTADDLGFIAQNVAQQTGADPNDPGFGSWFSEFVQSKTNTELAMMLIGIPLALAGVVSMMSGDGGFGSALMTALGVGAAGLGASGYLGQWLGDDGANPGDATMGGTQPTPQPPTADALEATRNAVSAYDFAKPTFGEQFGDWVGNRKYGDALTASRDKLTQGYAILDAIKRDPTLRDTMYDRAVNEGYDTLMGEIAQYPGQEARILRLLPESRRLIDEYRALQPETAAAPIPN